MISAKHLPQAGLMEVFVPLHSSEAEVVDIVHLELVAVVVDIVDLELVVAAVDAHRAHAVQVVAPLVSNVQATLVQHVCAQALGIESSDSDPSGSCSVQL